MHNPWEEIALTDYESHMSLETVYQLQTMNDMMREQCYAYDIKTLMILGIAGGNGLDHIKNGDFDRIYGVDINQHYLEACKQRYAHLANMFEPICTDLLRVDLQLPTADLLIANLLIEYIGYECFQRIVDLVMPQYVSCIIQINTESSFVSESPYLHVFQRLNEVHHQMDEPTLIAYMQQADYKVRLRQERALPNGKKLVRIDFTKLI